MVATERYSDLSVEAVDALVELKKAPGELGDDHLRHMLARQFDVLTAGSGQSPGGDAGGVSHLPAAQPLGQAGLAEPTQPSRAGILGEQDQRAFVGEVVELLFQGKDAGYDVAQSVDHPDPVGIRSLRCAVNLRNTR
jgi:hypothetical protein